MSFKHDLDASKLIGERVKCTTETGVDEEVVLLDPNAVISDEKALSKADRRCISRSVPNSYLIRFLWLPEHVPNNSVSSYLVGLKIKSLKVTSVTMEHHSGDEKMKDVENGTRRARVTCDPEDFNRLFGAAGIAVVHGERSLMTIAGFRKCTFCDEAGHIRSQCDLAKQQYTKCKRRRVSSLNCT